MFLYIDRFLFQFISLSFLYIFLFRSSSAFSNSVSYLRFFLQLPLELYYKIKMKTFQQVLSVSSIVLIDLIIPHHKKWGAILDLLCPVGRSVGRSVRPSVRPSPIRARSITPLLIEGFPSNLNDTFTSTRRCAEPMLLFCQLKVKVTVKFK